MPPSVLRLRGGDDAGGAADLSETAAKALIDAAGNDETALVQTLLDYRSSAQVQQQGCQRIIDSLAAVATNKTASESLRGSYRAAGGAKCVLESLREHRSGSVVVVVKVRDARRCAPAHMSGRKSSAHTSGGIRRRLYASISFAGDIAHVVLL